MSKMSTPAAKRRRLDMTAALHKPFQSPFKTPTQPSTGTLDHVPTAEETPLTNTSTASTPIPRKFIIPPFRKTPIRSPAVKKAFVRPPISTAQLNADPAIAPLIRAQRALEKQLREVKEQLDAAEQARQIENESRAFANGEVLDGELVELIGKWKGVSRAACEELFGGTKDKINRMGGPKAWREAEAEKKRFFAEYNDEPAPPQEQGSEDEDGNRREHVEERDFYAAHDFEPETEHEKEARGGNESRHEGPDDEFDMGSMLSIMNIDVKVIGYDREDQSWTV